jgi:hypothetical protein
MNRTQILNCKELVRLFMDPSIDFCIDINILNGIKHRLCDILIKYGLDSIDTSLDLKSIIQQLREMIRLDTNKIYMARIPGRILEDIQIEVFCTERDGRYNVCYLTDNGWTTLCSTLCTRSFNRKSKFLLLDNELICT